MKDTTMSNVDMFNYYASQLNLSKPQLEAVTNCFKACLEADEGEPVGNEQPEQTAPSQDRTQNASFQDDNMFAEQSMKDLMKTDNKMLQKTMNAKNSAAKPTRGDFKSMMDAGKSVAGGNYHNVVYNEEQRGRIQRWQTFLNKQLGANLDVDGKWGPKTAAAYQQYLASKKQA